MRTINYAIKWSLWWLHMVAHVIDGHSELQGGAAV
jgi:hypothetical protein